MDLLFNFFLIKKGTVVCVPECIHNSKMTHFLGIRMDSYFKHNILCCYQNRCWTEAQKIYFSCFRFAFLVRKTKCYFPGFHQLCPGFPMG